MMLSTARTLLEDLPSVEAFAAIAAACGWSFGDASNALCGIHCPAALTGFLQGQGLIEPGDLY